MEIDTGKPRPMVGVSLLIVKDNRVLLSRRKGSHGAGEYGTPGGHLENGEPFEGCALRELYEECGKGMRVTTPRFLCVTNLHDYLPKHYADIGMVSHWLDGEPELMEPDKCEGWEWHSMDDLIGGVPYNLFGAVRNLIIAYRTSQPYFG